MKPITMALIFGSFVGALGVVLASISCDILFKTNLIKNNVPPLLGFMVLCLEAMILAPLIKMIRGKRK